MKYKYSKEKAKKILQKYNKGGSVSLPVSKTISKQEIDSFTDYVNEYYGKKGIYADQLDGGFTKAELKKAVDKYISNLDKNSTWGYGDSLDRERVRQILQPSYKLYSEGGTIIGTPETPLARGLDIDYTGLVGETGGMSAGEMFAEGGSIGQMVNFEDWQLYDRGTDLERMKKSCNAIRKNGFKAIVVEDKDMYYVLYKSMSDSKGKRVYAEGGSLDNHGLKQGDEIIKTLSGGIQKIKTKDGQTMYVDLASGYRGAEPPLPFSKGGSLINERRHVNKSQDYEVRYAKNKPNRTGYKGKRSFNDGGFMTDPNFGDFQNQVYATGGGLKYSLVDGTSGRWISELPHSKYKIIKEVTNAQSNAGKNVTYTNIVLLKGSIVHNLKGGVFVENEKLKEKYPTIYNSKYGLPIIKKEETLNQIYNNSEILEYATGGDVKRNLSRDRKFKNYSEKHEVRYSKDKPHRRGYGYEEGGMIYKDLFEDYENQPAELSEIVSAYMEKFEEGDYDYEDSKKFLAEVESVGYTFDYGLDNEPYGLRPIGVKLSQIEGYEDMDDDGYFKKGGSIAEKSLYIPTYQVLKVHTTDGKVFENVYSDTNVITGVYVSEKPLRKKDVDDKNQLELFRKGGLPKTAIYIPRYKVDFIETEYDGDIQGNHIYGGVWIDMKKQFRLVEEAKKQGRFKPEKKEKISFEEWMKQNNIEVYKRTYYWVADDGKGDYLYSGNKADVMKSLREDWKKSYSGGGKTTFKEKATAIAKNFEGKKVEPKYQKEYGKVYDKAEAKEVGNKIAGSQKAKYDAKMVNGGSTKRKPKSASNNTMVLAKQIRKDGESWQSAMKRAKEQIAKK